MSILIDVTQTEGTNIYPQWENKTAFSGCGHILKSHTGYALVPLKVETAYDLISLFGYPTESNKLDWYNAYNYLEYSNDLYIVRPFAASAQNTSVKISSNSVTYTSVYAYNYSKAVSSLDSLSPTESLQFISRYLEKDTTFAFAICATSASWTSHITTETQKIYADEFQSVTWFLYSETNLSTYYFNGSAWNATTSTATSLITKKVQKVNATSPTSTLVTGLQFIIASSGVNYSAWSGKETQLAIYNSASTSWNFETAKTTFQVFAFNQIFNSQPDWNNNEFAFIIFKLIDGLYQLKEKYIVNKSTTSTQTYSYNNFIESIVNVKSNTVYVKKGSSDVTLNTTNLSIDNVKMYCNDSCFTSIDTSDYNKAISALITTTAVETSILMSYEDDINRMAEIAETETNKVAVVAPFKITSYFSMNANQITNSIIQDFGYNGTNGYFTAHNSYTYVYGNMKKQWDFYNNKHEWMSLIGDVAGIFSINNQWEIPMGRNRAYLKNVTKLLFSPNSAQFKLLNTNGINSIFYMGNKSKIPTLSNFAVASKNIILNNTNLRRLVIYLTYFVNKNLKFLVDNYINTYYTRKRVSMILDKELRKIKALKGLETYTIVCDSSNNTNKDKTLYITVRLTIFPIILEIELNIETSEKGIFVDLKL